MRWHRLIVIALAVATVFVEVDAARADNSASARRHFDRGVRAYNLQRFDVALSEFQAAYDDKPDPAFLFNIAQAQRQLGQNEAAIKSYRAYLAQQPDAPNAEEVKARIADLDRTIKEKQARDVSPSPPPPAAAPSAPQPTPPTTATNAVVATETPTQTRERPVYKRKWFWPVVVGGAAVVAAGIAVGVVFGSKTVDPHPSIGTATAMGF